MQQTHHLVIHQISVDDRERSSEVVSALKEKGAIIEYGRLRVGDYKVDDHLLVERKTIRDFARSVMSGRLFRQARRLASAPAGRPCIIVEGSPDDVRTGGLSRSGYHGALISLTLVYGLPIFRSSSPAETASVIILAAEQLRRRPSAPPRRYGRKPGSIQKIRTLMLQEIPFVGPERATLLLKTFRNPGGLASAPLDQIASVPGIGPKIATRIWTVFHDRGGDD